jgi:hypothetical protein
MDNFEEKFLDKKGKNEVVKGGLAEIEGLGGSPEDHINNMEEKKEPWGYEVLPNGELGVVDGLIDPEAGDGNQESLDSGVMDEIADAIMNDSQISLIAKNEEELDDFFDMLEQISRNLFISQNTEAIEKSKKLKNLTEKYRKDRESFLKRYSEINFGNLPEAE